jgi:hypothetical protein
MANCDMGEKLPILLRAFAVPMDMTAKPAKGKRPKRIVPPVDPADLHLVFDTETTSDAAMRCRIGCYRIYREGVLVEERLFYDPREAFPDDIATLLAYAEKHGLAAPITLAAFRRLLRKVYDAGGQIVGFNLPFDLSRIAIGSAAAKPPKWNRRMKGAHSLQLWDSRFAPRIQVKHINPRLAMMQFTNPNPGKSGSSRGRGDVIPAERGTFIDVRTTAAAILSGGYSLERLCETLDTATRKLGTAEHGQPLTPAYLDYARADVAATWGCFAALRQRYAGIGLSRPLHKIKSEAGLGKTMLAEMDITIEREKDPAKIARALHTYFGGRAEVHIRRQIVPVILTDFMSMYPTVCTLMGLWRFVIANGARERDATGETRVLLASARPEDWQEQTHWRGLTTLVRVRCARDLLPVRSYYAGEQHASIGLNLLTSPQPLWFTLADCLAAKFLSGKIPEIVEAVTFDPGPQQAGLQPIDLFDRLRLDPAKDDVFRELVAMREAENHRKETAPVEERDAIEAFRQFLKIVVNSTSYGSFMQLDVEDEDERKKARVMVHTADGEPFAANVSKIERPGSCFHPLLGTLITGAARLMLALAQCRTKAEGLDWAFCDTDSIALAKPEGMGDAEFITRANAVSAWFAPLNPYGSGASILKIEGVNYRPGTEEHLPLYCYAIAAKRYALFNLGDDGMPVIRKASAHGLGYLIAPYGDDDGAPGFPEPLPGLKAGKDRLLRWQHDLWFAILAHELSGAPGRARFDYHPALARPCLSRYGASSPAMLRWMDSHNEGLTYDDSVKPFGLLYGLHAKDRVPDFTGAEALDPPPPKPIHPVAPFHPDHAEAVARAFDRLTGEPVPPERLKTYADALKNYPYRQESKFENGEAFQRGVTRPRHVIASEIHYIGKEADRWEEEFLIGAGFDPMTRYGRNPDDNVALFDAIRDAVKRYGQKPVADATGLARGSIRRICAGNTVRTKTSESWIREGLKRLRSSANEWQA